MAYRTIHPIHPLLHEDIINKWAQKRSVKTNAFVLNAYNLAVMSILAYSDVRTDKTKSENNVSYFLAKFAKKKLGFVKKDQQVNPYVKKICKDKVKILI